MNSLLESLHGSWSHGPTRLVVNKQNSLKKSANQNLQKQEADTMSSIAEVAGEVGNASFSLVSRNSRAVRKIRETRAKFASAAISRV